MSVPKSPADSNEMPTPEDVAEGVREVTELHSDESGSAGDSKGEDEGAASATS